MISRTLYSFSNVKINNSGVFAQSLNYNVNSAHEQIEEYGNDNFYSILSEPITATCEISCYPGHNFGNLIKQLTDHTRSGSVRENVTTNFGSLDKALLSSFKMEAAVNSVPNASMTFIGAVSTGETLSGCSSPEFMSGIVSTEDIKINNGSGQAQKVSMSWDIPVSPILSYSGSLSYPTSFFGEPLGTATVNIQAMNGEIGSISCIDFGRINTTFSDIKVISSGVNQAVGTMGATYNVSFQCSANNVSFS